MSCNVFQINLAQHFNTFDVSQIADLNLAKAMQKAQCVIRGTSAELTAACRKCKFCVHVVGIMYSLLVQA